MAQEYIALKERNNAGVIALSKSAFQTIAKIVVEEDENIALAESAAPFKYPISCKIVNDQLILSIDIKVKYSVNVNEESSKVQSKIDQLRLWGSFSPFSHVHYLLLLVIFFDSC